MTLKSRLGSLKVTGNGAILYRLRHIATYWPKVAKFAYLICISAPLQEVIPSQLREDVLLLKQNDRATCGKETTTIIMLSHFQSIQYRAVTNGQTDRIPMSSVHSVN